MAARLSPVRKALDALRADVSLAARGPTRDRLDLYRSDPARLMADAGFAPDPWQVDLLRSADRRVLLLCSRQVGKSTSTAMLALKTALLEPGSTTVVVAPVAEQANELLRKVTGAYHAAAPPVGVVRESATRLDLANGSRVIALPGKESRMRSYTAALVIVDEAARVLDGVMYAVSPTMAVSGGRFVALSTAFSKSGWFYKTWTDRAEPYLRLSVRATDCPRIPREFLAAERRKLGPRWFDMEYMNVFGDDVAAVFSSGDVARAVSPDVKPLFDDDPAADPEPSVSVGVAPLF